MREVFIAIAQFKPKLAEPQKNIERMMQVVKYGGPANGLSALMASFSAALSDQDIADVVLHERKFAWPDAADDPQGKP